MNPIRVGVVGAGRMGQRHCRVYSGMRQAHLIGLCDSLPERGRQVAQEYDVTFYENMDVLLRNVDAVSIATPTPSHFDIAMRCLAQGVHVLIEKPITETVEQAEALVRAADASNVIVQIGHIERFNPAYIELKHVLEDMPILAADFRRLSPYAGSNTDVDVVLDLMIHDVDLALDLMGVEPASLNACGLTALSGDIDYAAAHLCFDSGPIFTMRASRATEQKVRSIDVTALKGYVEVDLLNKSVSVHRRTVGEYLNHNHQGVKYRQESIVERIHVPVLEPLLLELQHFTDCVAQNKPTKVSPRDGLNVLRLTLMIRDMIRSHISGLRERVEICTAQGWTAAPNP